MEINCECRSDLGSLKKPWRGEVTDMVYESDAPVYSKVIVDKRARLCKKFATVVSGDHPLWFGATFIQHFDAFLYPIVDTIRIETILGQQ